MHYESSNLEVPLYYKEDLYTFWAELYLSLKR